MDRITGFLNGKTVLLTGATGFLGQPVVEKILWAAPDVERIHVLIRPKRQFGGDVQSPRERLEKKLFTSSVFDRLRFRHGESFEAFLDEKLVAVAGDISESNLGIDPDVRAGLVRDLDVVLNSAAVVSFDAALDQALELNVLGAGRVAELAAECERAVLIHVSTAYVCGAIEGIVPETLHHAAPDATEPFPDRQIVDPEREIETIRSLIDEVRAEGESTRVRRELVAALVERRNRRGADKREPRRETIEKLKHQWMENRLVEAGMEWSRSRGWNDTYTYTKALGEQIVLRRRGETPAAIVRPAIIESSLHEPSPGWLDGLRMADPLIAAIGKGRLRSLPLDPELTIDLVPADMVVNAMLAAIPRLAEEGGTSIYQVATGSRNPITMGEMHHLIVRYFQANPMLDKKGDPIEVKSLRFPGSLRFRLEYKARAKPIGWAVSALEALLDRGVASRAAQKHRRKLAATRAALDKLFYYGELYEPYLNLDARFQVDRTMELFQWLTPEERRRFNFDVTRLNWRHYMHVHIAGLKKYILKVERAGTLEVDDEVAAHEASVSTIPDLLERTADRHPEKIALRVQRDGEWHEISYARLRTDVRAVAERLLRMGLTKGDRIVLVSENRPEWGVCYLGAATIGLVAVPLDAQTWHREVWATADYTGARAILASRSVLEAFTDDELAANEAAEEPRWLLCVDDHARPCDLEGHPRSSRPEISDAPVAYPEVESSDLASIIFTTGTAVDPKGAMHTHANFLNNLFGVSRYLSADDADEFLSVLPLYHALEFTCGLLMPIYRGATVTYARSIKPKVLIETMRETGTTVMLGVPTLFALIRDDIERRILRAGKSPLRSGLMKTSKRLVRGWERTVGKNIARQLFARVHEELGGRIRFFVSGGSKLGEELYADFKALGLTIYEGYGLTETAPVLTVNPLFQSRAGSAGKPLPGTELRLYHTDRDGVGEIIVRTPSLMKGYWDNPAATDRVMVDGWFHTGDLGWVDADGYLYITGRIKDVIVTGAGKNVYPMDLEAIYRELPEVREICVVGIRSGLTEDVHAAIVPTDAPADSSAEDVRKSVQRAVHAVARDLPSYHRLKQIHPWEEPLPRDDEGALDREGVRRAIERRLKGAPEPARRRAETAGVAPEAALRAELARLSRIPEQRIEPESDLYDDLGLDSLQAIELLLFLEHRFGVKLEDETAERIRTVGELLDETRARADRAARPTGPDGVPSGEPDRIRSARPWAERSPVDRALMGGFGRSVKALYSTWFDLEVRDPENLPATPPYLLAANHASHLDAPAILSAVREARGEDAARALHVLGARDYFFDSALKEWFFSTFLNVVPIEREESSLAGLRLVRSILRSGESALIFPEGTRSRTGEIQAFKPGLGLISRELDVPIVPVHVGGTHALLPADRSVPRRGRVTLTFGAPIAPAEWEALARDLPRDELYREIAADVRRRIVALGEASAEAGARDSARAAS